MEIIFISLVNMFTFTSCFIIHVHVLNKDEIDKKKTIVKIKYIPYLCIISAFSIFDGYYTFENTSFRFNKSHQVLSCF
jgi:hypothetical protein